MLARTSGYGSDRMTLPSYMSSSMTALDRAMLNSTPAASLRIPGCLKRISASQNARTHTWPCPPTPLCLSRSSLYKLILHLLLSGYLKITRPHMPTQPSMRLRALNLHHAPTAHILAATRLFHRMTSLKPPSRRIMTPSMTTPSGL